MSYPPGVDQLPINLSKTKSEGGRAMGGADKGTYL